MVLGIGFSEFLSTSLLSGEASCKGFNVKKVFICILFEDKFTSDEKCLRKYFRNCCFGVGN